MDTLDESGFRDSPPAGNPSPESGPLPTRARHYYPVDRGTLYSLRDAALALEISEGKLRRAILLDEVPAADVDDERQYLLDGAALQAYIRRIRPNENCMFPDNGNLFLELAYCLVIPLLILLVLIFAKSPDPARPGAAIKQTPPADCVPGDASGGAQENADPASEPCPRDSGAFPDF
jgi:hypothetical protein